jgi:hypothetical protein
METPDMHNRRLKRIYSPYHAQHQVRMIRLLTHIMHNRKLKRPDVISLGVTLSFAGKRIVGIGTELRV